MTKHNRRNAIKQMLATAFGVFLGGAGAVRAEEKSAPQHPLADGKLHYGGQTWDEDGTIRVYVDGEERSDIPPIVQVPSVWTEMTELESVTMTDTDYMTDLLTRMGEAAARSLDWEMGTAPPLPSQSGKMWLSGDAGIFVSYDNGLHWEKVEDLASNGQEIEFQVELHGYDAG